MRSSMVGHVDVSESKQPPSRRSLRERLRFAGREMLFVG
jgi:hypothetical protein